MPPIADAASALPTFAAMTYLSLLLMFFIAARYDTPRCQLFIIALSLPVVRHLSCLLFID
jgi:hypothetical protein